MALVHPLVFLPQRVDLEVKQASLYSHKWHSKITYLVLNESEHLLLFKVRELTLYFSSCLGCRERVKLPSQYLLYPGSHFNVSSAFLPFTVSYLVLLLKVIGIDSKENTAN